MQDKRPKCVEEYKKKTKPDPEEVKIETNDNLQITFSMGFDQEFEIQFSEKKKIKSI